MVIRGEITEDIESKGYMQRLFFWSLQSHGQLIEYLESKPLKTLRRIDFVRFARIYRMILSRKQIPWQGKVLARLKQLLKKLGEQNC